MADLVLHTKLRSARCRVTAPDDGDSAGSRGSDNSIHDRASAVGKGGHLKDTHGAVPHHRLGPRDDRGELLGRLGADVQAHQAIGNAALHCRGTHRRVRRKLVSSDKVKGQVNLHVLGRRLLDERVHNLGALLVEERLANLHIVEDLLEGKGHAAADNHLVHLVQQVADEGDLVSHLGAAEDGNIGPGGAFHRLGKVIQLLLHEHAGRAHGQLHAHHRAMRTVSSAKGVVDVDITELGQRGLEGSALVLGGLERLAGSIHALALLLDVEAQVLQQNHRARGGVGASGLDLSTHAIRQEEYLASQQLLQLHRDRLEGKLLLGLSIGTTKVAHQHNRLCSVVQRILDGRQSSLNTQSVGNLASLIRGDIKVHAHEHALASHIGVLNPNLRHGVLFVMKVPEPKLQNRKTTHKPR
eukprot:m.155639 g.155639  ORF g.155639 m.155639 type:complete len:412 (+) comp15146_c8_seq1:237-1472(+)